MAVPALDTTRMVRSVLLFIALYLSVIMISVMAMVKPAHASGDVQRISLWCSNEYSPASCTYSTEEAACAAMGAANPFYNYNLFVVHFSGNEVSGDACYGHPANSPNDNYWAQRLGWLAQGSACPSNSTPTSTTTCTCTDPYVPDSNKTSCVLSACPDHASRATPGAACTCDAGYQFDAAGTSCVSTCPVDPLPQPPFPASDTCSNSLEQGAGVDVNNACATGLTPDMQTGAQCVADKIHALAIPYSGPSATVRTAAYQDHLLDVWNKSTDIEDLSDAEKQACATVIADVDKEMKWHKIRSGPSSAGDEAPHVLGQAIDIPTDVINAMIAQVTNTTFVTFPDCIFCIPYTITIIGDVQDYVNSALINPPACNLSWGGRFSDIDNIHFQLP